MLGNLINIGAILAGCIIGKIFGGRIKESFRDAATKAGGLALAILGVKMALGGEHFILMLLSVVFGSIIGEAIDINGAMERFGKMAENKLNRLAKSGADGHAGVNANGKANGGDASGGGFGKAFVYSTLLFCIGPMSIMGSITGGLTGDHSILITKAVMDGIFSSILTVTMGLGVAGSAVTTGLYQGLIVLSAGWIERFLTEAIVTEMTATGGLLIVAISSNMLKVKAFKTANMLPSLLIICLLAAVWP